MKKLCPTLLTIFLLTNFLLTLNLFTYSQGCLPEGITFTTQQQIDDFQINYPGCTEIEGDVIIMGSEINNLTGLNEITSINGMVWIDSTQITNLQGLNSLSVIGGKLGLVYNIDLVSLAGLDALTIIDEGIAIGISSVTNFTGMPNLNQIGGLSVHLAGTTSLTGLENLSTINGQISLSNCFELTSIEGLTNITTINGGINIFNTGLTSLSGLDNITPSSITSISVSFNEQLSDCDVWSICEYLSTSSGTVIIENNSTGCDNPQEVELACLTGTEEFKETKNAIQFFPNPAKNTITIISQSKVKEAIIYNQTGQVVLFQESLDNNLDISNIPSGLYFIEIRTKFGNHREKLIIK